MKQYSHRDTETQSIRDGHLIIYRVHRDGFAVKSSRSVHISVASIFSLRRSLLCVLRHEWVSVSLWLCVGPTKKAPRENRIFENSLLEVQSAFQAFWTPIPKYTNIDYQCVTSLSPKSDENTKKPPAMTQEAFLCRIEIVSKRRQRWLFHRNHSV